MRKLLALWALMLCAGCAGQVAPDQRDTPLAASSNPYCLRDTGTRIAVPEGQCAPAVGHVYTREQLDQTGAATLGEALSRLVPY